MTADSTRLTQIASATRTVAVEQVNEVSPMPSLTLKDIPTPLLKQLRSHAAEDRRSLNREAIWLRFAQLAPQRTQRQSKRKDLVSDWR